MRGGPDLDAASLEREEIYAGSVRRHCEAKRQEILHERLRYHRESIERHRRVLEVLIERHRAGVEECEHMLGIVGNDDERKAS